MKTFLSLLLISGLSHAATVATAIVPYRSIEDSPWKVAVKAGDALTFLNHSAESCDDTLLPPTLPDGLGVYDDFGDCRTPWAVPFGAASDHSRSVDADDGFIDGILNGTSLEQSSSFVTFGIEFYPTSDSKLPRWFGFASLSGRRITPPTLRVFGASGDLLDTINLIDMNVAFPTISSGVRFQGFLFDQEVGRIEFGGGLVIDHFQYGYGAAPIPEPTGLVLLSVVGVLRISRRRRGLGCAVKQPSSLQRHG